MVDTVFGAKFGRTNGAHFLGHDDLFCQARPHAPIFLRPMGRDPALVIEFAVPWNEHFWPLAQCVIAQTGVQIFPQPGAHLGAKGLFFLAFGSEHNVPLGFGA